MVKFWLPLILTEIPPQLGKSMNPTNLSFGKIKKNQSCGAKDLLIKVPQNG
jgi:hypothetical protein